MSEKAMCTHDFFRTRTEVDHEGMSMEWLECSICGQRVYVTEWNPEVIASLRTQLQEAREKLNRAYIDEVYQDNEIRELAERLETAMEILNACEIDLKIRLNSLKAFGGGSGVERIEDTLSRISSFLCDGTEVKP